jgi:hypothetical protein
MENHLLLREEQNFQLLFFMVQFIFLIERTPGYISALKFYFPPPTITSKKYGGGNLLHLHIVVLATFAHSGTCYTCTQWYLLHFHTVVLHTQWFWLHLHTVVLAAHSHGGTGYTFTRWHLLHQITVVLATLAHCASVASTTVVPATHSHGGTCYTRSLWYWRHLHTVLVAIVPVVLATLAKSEEACCTLYTQH